MTTYKLYSGAATDGAVYIDLPISGKIAAISFLVYLQAGAGGIAAWTAELSRQAVNQITTNNPRGVIGQCTATTSAASTGTVETMVQFPNEPVKSGERLYLNCASAANWAAGHSTAFVTIG